MKLINVRLFGAFKKHVPSGFIEISVDSPCTVKELKSKVHEYLKSQVPTYAESLLVFESALATDSEILNDENLSLKAENYALLPPVCGG